MVPIIKKLKNHYIFSQPHQPFFILAFVNALISMALFALVFTGNISSNIPAKFYHAYSILYLLFTPAFLAFLFTTFPRFSATEPILKKEYLRVFLFYLLGSLLVILGLLVSTPLFSTGILLTFMAHLFASKILLNIYLKSDISDKSDQFWILIATGFGLFAHLLFLISLWLPQLYSFAIQIAIYLYLFLMFFTVAQRMVPFFSNAPIEKHVERFKVIVGLLGLHLLLELIQPHSSFLADLFLAYIIGRELYRWKLPFPNSNPLLWVMHIALFWIPIAFVITSISSIITLSTGVSYLYLGIHTLGLGFFFTMLIGFGTRVTLGHSGNIMRADRYVTSLFYATQLVVISRILTSISLLGSDFVLFFNISIIVWILFFIAWAYRFFAVLIFGKKL